MATTPMVHHGKNGAVKITIAPASTPVQIATISDWTLDMSMATVETTAMGDPNKTYVVGLKDIKGTLTAFWDSNDDSFFEGIDSPSGVSLELYPDTVNAAAACFKGPAWLSGSIKSGVAAAVVLTGNFVANGAWTRIPASGTMAAKKTPAAATPAPGMPAAPPLPPPAPLPAAA